MERVVNSKEARTKRDGNGGGARGRGPVETVEQGACVCVPVEAGRGHDMPQKSDTKNPAEIALGAFSTRHSGFLEGGAGAQLFSRWRAARTLYAGVSRKAQATSPAAKTPARQNKRIVASRTSDQVRPGRPSWNAIAVLYVVIAKQVKRGNRLRYNRLGTAILEKRTVQPRFECWQ